RAADAEVGSGMWEVGSGKRFSIRVPTSNFPLPTSHFPLCPAKLITIRRRVPSVPAMIIQKQYKFYAAHRNEQLKDKCHNLHGHRYGLVCHFEVERTGALSTLFGDFDAKIEPYLKENYDHGMLINRTDPLYATLQDHERRTGERFRFKVFDAPTTVENLAFTLSTEIT